MLEKIGNQDILVKNYTSNFDVKQFIQEALIPKAFPGVPMNKLNLGYTGITSEMIATAIEDAFGTASLMLNESFITRATLPSSIYAEASLFNLGYTFARPSRCNFAVQIWLDDLIKYSTQVRNTPTRRYRLDKNTKLILGDNIYRFDYDIIIDHQIIDGQKAYSVYYDITEDNSIAITTNRYIKHLVTSIGWIVLFVDMQEFDRKIEVNTIADNLVTTNSDILLRWHRQIAGIDLIYITPRGERIPMKKKIQHTRPEQDPFAWYTFFNESTLRLMFGSNSGFFQPAFNSKIESTIYTCTGASANFDSYDNKTAVPVQRTGERFEYNASTRMIALCYSGSTGGTDRGDIELLRDDIITAHNTVNVLSTDHDLDLWFNNQAKRYNTKARFFKRRDDPTGRLFSQFISIVDDSYIYPTNTLTIDVNQFDCDFVNNDESGINKEFIIKPGHLWEYEKLSNDLVVDSQLGSGRPGNKTDWPQVFIGARVLVENDSSNNGANTIYEVTAIRTDGTIIYQVTADEFTRDRVVMVPGIGGMAMVTDEALPQITTSRPFMFVNPFYIKIHRDPTMSSIYNCLIDHTSWPEDIPVDNNVFHKFQLATLSVQRSLSKKGNNKYKIQVICVPVVTDSGTKYVEGVGEDFDIVKNNLRLVLVTRSRVDGETGYIEMVPIELRNNGAILFETYIAIYDNLRSDMMLQIDLDRTIGMESLISSGPRMGEVYVDSAETSFHFLVMMKDNRGLQTTTLYNNPTYEGYVIANRFANQHRDLTLYKPMTMMRSVVLFAGSNNDYDIRISLVPFLKYDIPLDDEKMEYFIRAFGEQYLAMEPIVKRLDGNSSLDLKLFNTYGRSNNYYIGPPDNSDVLWDSNTLLDSVYVKIKLKIAVYDRSAYVQTVDAVINEIKAYFESLSNGEILDIHVSDLIHLIKDNHPNVNYIRFHGFNDYDANKQSIFVKYDEISDLREDQLAPFVPEMIRVDSQSIIIHEEA